MLKEELKAKKKAWREAHKEEIINALTEGGYKPRIVRTNI